MSQTGIPTCRSAAVKRCRGRLPGLARLFVPITLLLAASLACAVPIARQPVTTPGLPTAAPAQVEGTAEVAPQAQVQEPQAAPAVELPPALVEVDPLPRSVLSPGTTPLFYFNQPMDRASVEAALQLQPVLPVHFEWLDDATLRLIPDSAPETGSDLLVTIATTARAANGQALGEPVQITYAAPGDLRLVERLPVPGGADVNPSSALVATLAMPTCSKIRCR